MEMADRYWGKRAQYSYQWRAQLNAGAKLAFGSDSPIDPFDPFKGIYAAVVRRREDGYPNPQGWYPEARLTMQETLQAYTTGAAYAAGMEDRSGKLSAGFLADVIVLDRNLFEIGEDEILSTQVLGTMVGGVWRHRVFE